MSRARARGLGGAARLRVHRDRRAGPVRHRRQAADRPRPAAGRGQRHHGLRAVRLAGRLCKPAVRPCHHGLCGAGRHRRDLSAGAGADVDLRRADRVQPGGWSPRIIRATWSPAPWSARRARWLVQQWFAARGLGFAVTGGWRSTADARARASGASSKRLPAACTLPRSTRHERRFDERARGFRHRSGPERGRQYRAAGRGDCGGAGRPPVRGGLRQ